MALDDKAVTKEDRWIGDVWIDVFVEESFSLTAQVTDHPVERGADISDHVHVMPEQLTIMGLVTNTPIEVPQSHLGGSAQDPSPQVVFGEPEQAAVLGIAQAAFGPLGALLKSVSPVSYRQFSMESLHFTEAFDRVTAVDQALTALVQARVPVPVYTSRRAYEEVILTNYDPKPGPRSILEFTLTGRVVLVVDSELVDVPKPKERRSEPKQIKGKKSATPASPAAPPSESLLHKMLG